MELMPAYYIVLTLFFIAIFVIKNKVKTYLMKGEKSDFESLVERYKENIEK